jgi:competence ComEA-like helix-hairpin-helix protein
VQTILNYRNKGGKFRKPEDIRKIWGLQKEEAERILPWAEIRDAIGKTSAVFTSNPSKQVQMVDINTGSAKDFMQLPGIEPTVAYRMVHFRDKLGGFISLEQLRETYGLNDSLFMKIAGHLTFKEPTVKKININTASEAELNAHPYLKREVARAIILYREKHGNFTNIETIRKIGFISEEIIRKILPYLAVE